VRTVSVSVAGDECAIHFLERAEDVEQFERFISSERLIALDTEATGLDVYTPGHALRLVQFGSAREAFVLRADQFGPVIARALEAGRFFVCHNFAFDAQVLDRHLGVPIEMLGAKTFDTKILAHLLDPRAQQEGGTGHGLKRLAEVWVDPAAPDGEKVLREVFRKEYGATISTGWAVIAADHPDLVRYAGLDVLLTRRLFDVLSPMVKDVGLDHLSQFEHHLQALLATMQRRGMRLDVAYTQRLASDLEVEAEEFRGKAARYGVENVNSTAQVAAALGAMGETLLEQTGAGAVKVDKAVLLPLADLDMQWNRLGVRDPNPLAEAVLRCKRASKWRESYAQAFLDLRDASDRIHPMISSLQARTARMSVSRPPLQQLPSSDWKVRRAFVADPGQLLIACDYEQIEMRVLAALADERTMLEAIASGVDLHDFTAERIYGEGFSKQQRKIAKGVGFGKVYGGGADTLSRQTGADIGAVREAISAYDRTFPGVKRYAKRLQLRAEFGKREVITPSGRHLPLDRDRLYAATNYVVQSTARDVIAQAIVSLFEKGLGDHLLMVVHDELIAQAPAEDAREVMEAIRSVMEMDFFGVRLASDGEVVGPSWGHGYGYEERNNVG
jgi:DNA polymerase I